MTDLNEMYLGAGGSDIEQCEADHADLKSVDGIEAKSAAFIIWSARLDIKIAIAQFKASNLDASLADMESALVKLELLKV